MVDFLFALHFKIRTLDIAVYYYTEFINIWETRYLYQTFLVFQVSRTYYFIMTTLILVCLAYNPLSPDIYFKEIERANAVKTVIESTLVLQEPKEEKKVSTKKQTKSKSWYDTPQGNDKSYWANRIREISKEVGYKNHELAVKISMCESWLRPGAKSKISSAGGLFQHLARFWDARAKKYWFAWASRFDWEANAYVSISMLRDGWLSHWKESRWCRWR